MKSRRIEAPIRVAPPAKIEITMTESEAETILAVTRRIGGTPHNTRRKHTDALGVALVNAGVELADDSIGLCISGKWISEEAHSINFVMDSLPRDERTER